MNNSGDYPPLPHELLDLLSNNLKGYGFKYSGNLLRGALFTNFNDIAVMFDYKISDLKWPFLYSSYTEEQNRLMHKHKSLYRFILGDYSDIKRLNEVLQMFINHSYEDDDFIPKNASDRQTSAIDPTLPESIFEQAFIDVYGRQSLDYVMREYPIIDVNGKNRFIDYYIERHCGNIAIEKNGERYHHPQLINIQQYHEQLEKQNSLAAYGIRVYRWSLDGMKFKERFHDELKQYLGDSSTFIRSKKLVMNRAYSLYNHQETALQDLKTCRAEGKNASLVVLPTGTGKTEILISDYVTMYKECGEKLKGLILVPSINLKMQLISKLHDRLPEYGINLNKIEISEQENANITIQTYAWLTRNIHYLNTDKVEYLVIDEAHHVMAPALKKAIHKFNPKFLLGLTATDQRLDAAKLDEIFGKYEVNLSLVEAIKEGLLSPIRAFRLKSNIDLSEIRFNGRDYVNTDLERTVIVPSRDQLIVDMLQKYFTGNSLLNKSGLIFCVSVAHAEKLAKRMRDAGISAESVSGVDDKSSKKIKLYQDGEIQFLTTCSLLSEGWDSPRTSIIVMARPTMSKVLYTQQIGRGTRKNPDKEALYVIDVVDNYGSIGSIKNIPWSIHSLLGISSYLPWDDVIKTSTSDEEITVLSGLYEEIRSIEEIDIFTFEYKYPYHLSDEQAARELFISTDTLKNWVKNGTINPAVRIPFGQKTLNFFSPEQLVEIRREKKLTIHNDSTMYDDFFKFIEERSYTMSYKIIMMLSLMKIVDVNGECNLNDLVSEYANFYKERLINNLPIDKTTCPYSLDNINDADLIQLSLLTNPFEKFERKRFLFLCKDLNRISFAIALWEKLDKLNDFKRIKKQLIDDLVNYYKELGGVPNIAKWTEYWNISNDNVQIELQSKLEIVSNPPDSLKYVSYVPYFDIEIAAGYFGLEQDIAGSCSGWLHLPDERLRNEMFVARIKGRSMEPDIPDNSLALFRAGSALAGSRQNRIVLIQHDGTTDPETGYSFTVKKYSSKKVYDEFDGFQHDVIELSPINKDFKTIVIENAEENEYRVIGEFIKVL